MTAHLPTLDASGVVVCGECGEPLELRCANGHDPLPIGVTAEFTIEASEPVQLGRHPKPVDKGTTRDGQPRKRARPAHPPHFAVKQCVCGAMFTPTGPNTKRCESCR